jgi:hypothetical protein
MQLKRFGDMVISLQKAASLLIIWNTVRGKVSNDLYTKVLMETGAEVQWSCGGRMMPRGEYDMAGGIKLARMGGNWNGSLGALARHYSTLGETSERRARSTRSC